jgi:protein phosphatase 1G
MGQSHGRTEPDTEKKVEDGAACELAYGTCGMRGWRENMEDAHLVDLEFTPELSLLGVFDGHGGGAVAKYVALNLGAMVTQEVAAAKTAKNASSVVGAALGEAMRCSFLAMDVQLKTKEAVAELAAFENAEEAAAEAEAEAEAKAAEEAAAAEDAGADGGAEEEGEGHPLNDLDDDQEVKVRFGADGALEIGVVEGAASGEGAAEGGEAAEDEDDGEEQGDPPITMSLSALKRLLAGQGSFRQLMGGGAEGDAEEGAEGDEGEPLNPAVHCGCTSVVACVDRKRRELVVANAGDSRCVLSRGGVAVDLSEDHTPTLARELARITKAGGTVTEEGRIDGNLNLSRAIGDFSMKQNDALSAVEQKVSAEPEIRVEALTGAEDFVILACDGIWERLSSQEVVDFVSARLAGASAGASAGAAGKRARATPKALSVICGELCDECLASDRDEHDGYGCDNMTVLIVDLRGMLAAEGGAEMPAKRAKA